MMASEQQIQRDVQEYLRYCGYFCFKVHSQGKFCYKGITDLIAIKDGQTLFVEVKGDKGKLSVDQIKFMDDIKDHGGVHVIARSIDDVRNIIKEVAV